MYIVIIVVIAIILIWHFTRKQCKGIAPIQFIYKTLRGDISIAYVGHICETTRKDVIRAINPATDIIIIRLVDDPVTSIDKKYLEQVRGWVKISYQPPTVYQAADIERMARGLLEKMSATPATPSVPPFDCAAEFVKNGCRDANVIKNCPDMCNSGGLAANELVNVPDDDTCILGIDDYEYLF